MAWRYFADGSAYNSATGEVKPKPEQQQSYTGSDSSKWSINKPQTEQKEPVIAEGTQQGEKIYKSGQWITFDRIPEAMKNKARVDSGELTSASSAYTSQNKQQFIDAGFEIKGNQALYIKPASVSTPAPSTTTRQSYINASGKIVTPETVEMEENFKKLGFKVSGQADFQTAGAGKLTFKNGITTDETGKVIGVGDLTGGQAQTEGTGWYDEVTGKDTPVGVGTPRPTTTTEETQQILNTEAMAKYTPDQYERLEDGRVILKAGVQPIAGTTKATTVEGGIPKLNQQQELKAAQDRISAGTANDDDKKNVDYAISKGIIDGTTAISEIPSVDELSDGGGAGVATATDPLPVYENQVGSLNQQITSLKSELENTYKTKETEYQKQVDDANAKIAKLQEQQKSAIEETDPTKSQFYDQETTILQNQLDAAEFASTKLQEDYEKARSLTTELDALNNQANADIQAMKGVTGLASIRTPRINAKIDEWTGRASILQAALAGVQDNIDLSFQYIDAAQKDIKARKDEEIAYYTSLKDYYSGIETSEEGKLTQAQTDKQDMIDNIIGQKETEIENLQYTVDLVNAEMINDPARVAGAGINLATDNLETITQKLADYDYRQETIDKKNTMEAEGYTYISNLNGITSEAQITRITDSKGVERIYKNPVENVKAGSGVGTGASSPIVDAYVAQVNSGALELSSVPADYRGDVALQLGTTAPTSPLDADLEGAARVVMALENAGASTDEAYFGIVKQLAEDLGLPEASVDKTLIEKINQLKGVQPTAEAPVAEEENIGSDFDINSTEPQIGESGEVVLPTDKLKFEDVFNK